MKEIESRLTIDLSSCNQPWDVYTREGNTGTRPFEIDLNNGEEDYDLTGLTLRLYMQKPDGHIVYIPLTADTPATGRIRIQPTAQMLAAPGCGLCEIEICQGDKRLTTVPFRLHIEPSIRDDDAVESADEFTALQDALNRLEALTGLPDRLDEIENRLDKLEQGCGQVAGLAYNNMVVQDDPPTDGRIPNWGQSGYIQTGDLYVGDKPPEGTAFWAKAPGGKNE